MAKNSKKAVLLIAASVVLYAWQAFCADINCINQPNTPKQIQTKYDFTLAKDPNFTMDKTSQLSTREMFFKMILAILIVLVLGSAAVYFSRKVSSRFVNAPGREIRLLETLNLGSHKSLHLVKVGNQKILIGCTADNISKLTEINDDKS